MLRQASTGSDNSCPGRPAGLGCTPRKGQGLGCRGSREDECTSATTHQQHRPRPTMAGPDEERGGGARSSLNADDGGSSFILAMQVRKLQVGGQWQAVSLVRVSSLRRRSRPDEVKWRRR